MLLLPTKRIASTTFAQIKRIRRLWKLQLAVLWRFWRPNVYPGATLLVTGELLLIAVSTTCLTYNRLTCTIKESIAIIYDIRIHDTRFAILCWLIWRPSVSVVTASSGFKRLQAKPGIKQPHSRSSHASQLCNADLVRLTSRRVLPVMPLAPNPTPRSRVRTRTPRYVRVPTLYTCWSMGSACLPTYAGAMTSSVITRSVESWCISR